MGSKGIASGTVESCHLALVVLAEREYTDRRGLLVLESVPEGFVVGGGFRQGETQSGDHALGAAVVDSTFLVGVALLGRLTNYEAIGDSTIS